MLVTLTDTALEATTCRSPARTLADVRDVLLGLLETDPKETRLQLSAINTRRPRVPLCPGRSVGGSGPASPS